MHGLLRIFRFTSMVVMLACHTVALADDRGTRAKDALDGTWQADVTDTQAIFLSIKGTDIEMSAAAGEKRLPVWIGKLIISKDEPSQYMDWVELRSGDTKLPDNKCLYRLRGDVLLVIGGGPIHRPTKFFSSSGGDPKTLVFIRTIPEKEGGRTKH
ncbi:MAG: hypothetical protein U0941_14880 [Planctomycetaceae bacterium]